MTETTGPLTEEEGRETLELARRSLEHYIRTGEMLELEHPPVGGLALPCGAFVSLHTKGDELRGCIGHMVGEGSVRDLILELAVAAGTRDSRFVPVRESELPELVYEVSVLAPMRATRADAVVPGVHGLYVRRGMRSGVLLPQVAREWNWDRETFLANTCQKAGLPADAWRDPDTEILTFTAQVFHD